VLARAAAWLDRAAFQPASLPDDLITGIALTPAVIAGLVLFKLAAAEILLIAAAFGAAAQIAAWILWRNSSPRLSASPLLAAVVGVALVGAGAGLATSIEIAGIAVALELLRARLMPSIRAQTGLLAYAVVALVTRGAQAAYVKPATGLAFSDPIGIWHRFFSPGSAPVDPMQLYVGNVPGPVFATSLLAVAIGLAWLAYARRLSPVVLVTFLAGALVPIYLYHWDYLFQLDSGPTWFVAGLVLSDRRYLPDSWAIRPVLGLVAGAIALGVRRGGYGIEGTILTIAGVQAAIAVLTILMWAASASIGRWRRARRLREREANLRVVKGYPRAG
jgi:Na+-transporting NADH:ubiquinone oxidoreductase subunit NqrB